VKSAISDLKAIGGFISIIATTLADSAAGFALGATLLLADWAIARSY